ncbi:MAG TPA: nucleotide exchange factor GrpE [Anaerolineaceae bacterium]|nr:nucleotide exchange factor GrpE [Anaerolineaceae bacterium]
MDEAKKHGRKTHQQEMETGEHEKTDKTSEKKLVEEIDHLNTRLAELEKEAANNLDGWQRERAEFSNYKKRVERDHAQSRQDITGAIIKKYLVVLDDLELALKDKPISGSGEAWANGIELIARKLLAIIEAEGVERVHQNRVPFDPTIHEAISSEENADFESGEVIEVIRHGYKLGDRVLRPAMVRVAR